MYPEWVEKQRKKGTNISCINGKYYLYAVTSVWNKEKGRAQMVNKGYLGRITEEGFIPKSEKKPKYEPAVTVKEFGATNVLYEMSGDIREKLEASFGDSGLTVYAIALMRLLNNCPFKRIELCYRHSFLSELLPSLKLTGKNISDFMSVFGEDRAKISRFMTGLIGEGGHILFDGTSIISKSEKMNTNRKGYNAHKEFDPQINLMYAFSQDKKMPAYYRIVPGNVRDVTAFKLSAEESGIKNAVIIADKGFGSEANFSLLKESGLQYIVPLKRNSNLIDYSKLKTADKSAFDGYFLHEKRPIWYCVLDGVMLFLDTELKAEEEKSYIQKIEANTDGYTMPAFIEKQHVFGTIAIRTNLPSPPSEVYALYKQRREIEQSFDFLKNLLSQDKCFMQNEKSLEAWAFINHITLLLCYKIYNLIREKKLISQYSVSDFLSSLKYVSKIKIGNRWTISEITKSTKVMMEGLGVHIT
jgi:transposase